MVVFNYSNAKEVAEAEIVIVGVPDESKSHSNRKGANKGPDVLRTITNEVNFFVREGIVIPISPMRGSLKGKLIYDYGNIKRDQVYQLILDLVSNGKIPIVIGGDHSITSSILQAIGDFLG